MQQSAGRIGILPGNGITPENVADLVDYTGVNEFHATAFSTLKSEMQHQNKAVYMGIPGLAEYERLITSTAEVARYLKAVDA